MKGAYMTDIKRIPKEAIQKIFTIIGGENKKIDTQEECKLLSIWFEKNKPFLNQEDKDYISNWINNFSPNEESAKPEKN